MIATAAAFTSGRSLRSVMNAAFQCSFFPLPRCTRLRLQNGEVPSSRRAQNPNFPLAFFHSLLSGIVSIVSQCSAILPFATLNRS